MKPFLVPPGDLEKEKRRLQDILAKGKESEPLKRKPTPQEQQDEVSSDPPDRFKERESPPIHLGVQGPGVGGWKTRGRIRNRTTEPPDRVPLCSGEGNRGQEGIPE